MPDIPALRDDQVVRALEKAGFKVVRTRGSHHIMRNSERRGTTVPVHPGRDIKKATVRGILRDVGMTVEEFLTLL
ncbi:hypothetical protein Acsp04_53830 [Actinomadura sp. NBRC 104425]|uniref:type II toxin-antitoxin system HicA family toxin n=1 Tax=Actinomadura sp. NBRC 104425 TaxID=3032204 RepID=UPI0024A2761C|nr:type II toxin-antitoxin system HicA family toxin [Actinomadura sp. NBRC 104425]GLZ15148.1 hypothetical protein Acsp04_53830 [Actinomadura sp. NBRC 104425]